MTRLLQPAPRVEVELGPEGTPRHLDGPVRGRLEVLTCWSVEQDWWEHPVARRYWKLLVENRLLVEVFHDETAGGWFLERIYD